MKRLFIYVFWYNDIAHSRDFITNTLVKVLCFLSKRGHTSLRKVDFTLMLTFMVGQIFGEFYEGKKVKVEQMHNAIQTGFQPCILECTKILKIKFLIPFASFFGAKAPLQPTSSEGVYVCMSVCMYVLYVSPPLPYVSWNTFIIAGHNFLTKLFRLISSLNSVEYEIGFRLEEFFSVFSTSSSIYCVN